MGWRFFGKNQFAREYRRDSPTLFGQRQLCGMVEGRPWAALSAADWLVVNLRSCNMLRKMVACMALVGFMAAGCAEEKKAPAKSGGAAPAAKDAPKDATKK